MGGWWVAEAWQQGPIHLGSWVFWVIFSIVLHELSHGWAALRQGDGTPRWTGHMTWNPIVHMGPTSLLVFALFGLAWGAMPVDPSRFRSRYGEAFVAFAGPLMNFALFAACLVSSVLWSKFAGGVRDPVQGNVAVFLFYGTWLNIVLGLFNLLPVPPLDGSRILADFVPSYRNLWVGERGQILSIVAFALVFLYGIRIVEPLAVEITRSLLSVVRGVLGP